MTTLLGTLLGIVVLLLLSALVIYVVGRLNLGMEVASFTAAIITAVVIAIVTGIINWLLGLVGIDFVDPGILGAILALVVAAVVLMISDRFVSGMRVNGFVGALIAAIAIGVGNWIVHWLVNLIL